MLPQRLSAHRFLLLLRNAVVGTDPPNARSIRPQLACAMLWLDHYLNCERGLRFSAGAVTQVSFRFLTGNSAGRPCNLTKLDFVVPSVTATTSADLHGVFPAAA